MPALVGRAKSAFSACCTTVRLLHGRQRLWARNSRSRSLILRHQRSQFSQPLASLRESGRDALECTENRLSCDLLAQSATSTSRGHWASLRKSAG
jgi:hypothetical protein